MEQRKRNPSGIEGVLGQPQHHGGIFADGIEHHRPRKFRGRFPENIDTLGFESLQVAQLPLSRRDRPLVPCYSKCYFAEQLLRRTCHWFFPLFESCVRKQKNPPARASGGWSAIILL